MKKYRSLPNNSDGIFSVSSSVSSSVHPPFNLRSFSVQPPFNLRSSSVQPPFILRSSSVQPPFKLRSTSVQPPFILRSSSVQAPFNLRSTSVRAPFELRSSSVRSPFVLRSRSVSRSKNERRSIEEWSKKYRRIIGGKTEMYRNSNGKSRERRAEQKLYFASNDILKSVRHCDTKLFFPNKHWGSELILTFWNAINLQKNLESALSCCNFVLASLLKHALFWRVRIPMSFRYHSEGTQYAFWSYFLTLKLISSWQKFPFFPIKHLCPKFKLSSGDGKNIGTEKDDMKKSFRSSDETSSLISDSPLLWI